MTPARKRRLYMVLGIIGGVAVAAGFGMKAFESSIGFRTPTEVLAGTIAPGKRFQLGGMVKTGSFQRTPGSLDVRFVVKDLDNELPVFYNKLLPDLFKENTGVVMNGRMKNGVFVADEVLAKHDENYMPEVLGKALKKGESRVEPASPRPSQQGY